MAKLWLVRAGRNGEREQVAISEGLVAPGFLDVPTLEIASTREAVLEVVAKCFPDAGANRVRNFTNQLNQFRNVMQVNDLVVMPR